MKLESKTYQTRAEKVIDFLVGFIGWFVVNFVVWSVAGIVQVALKVQTPLIAVSPSAATSTPHVKPPGDYYLYLI